MAAVGCLRLRRNRRWGRSGGECSDLGEVMGEDAVAAPGAGTVDAVEQAAVPTGSAFEMADAALAFGSPLDQVAESTSVFGRPAGGAGFGLTRYRHGAHAKMMELGLDAGFAMAAVGGDRAAAGRHDW
jgi:hypothetical protein